MEKICAAAIKFYPKDSGWPVIVMSYRHAECFGWMFKHQVDYEKFSHVQGFVTNANRFVDRYEAAQIAWRARQFLEESNVYHQMTVDLEKNGVFTRAYMLFSEDLW